MTTPADDARAAGAAVLSSANAGWLRTLGRFGYAAQGVVWLLLGWAALQVAVGTTPDSQASQTGAMRELASTAVGRVVLAVMVVGLLSYLVWQVLEAGWGYRSRSGRKRTLKRIGSVGKALFAGALVVTALDLLITSSADDQTEERATATLLATPGGVAVVMAVGAAIAALGAYWVYRGTSADFREKLEPGVSGWVIRLGQVGHLGRGIATAVLGVLVVVGGLTGDPDQGGGIDSALGTIARLPVGTVLLSAVALGLMAFGLFQIVAARHLREG